MKALHGVLLVALVCASSAIAADPPTENQGANAMNDRIAKESNGLLSLLRFKKTNGQKANFGGMEMYSMECEVEVIANQDCAMTGYRFGGEWTGNFGALKAQKNASELEAFNPLAVTIQ